MSTAPTAALLLSDVPQKMSVEGYAVPYSAAPDETINFFVSSSVSFEVAFVRLTDTRDGRRNGTPLIPVIQYPARFQRTHRSAWRDGCYWKCTFSLQVPSQWSSGLYAAECRWGNGGVEHILFVVRPPNGRQSDILVVANTNTWNAYNKWGGYSRYEPYDRDVTATTFERPNPCASSLIENENNAGNAWVRTEICVLRWLSGAHYEVDVISDRDFSSGTVRLSAYRAIVLSTHPEYWTREMLDNLETYLA